MDLLPSFMSTALRKRANETNPRGLVRPANPLTYPKSTEPFSSKLFKNPTSEYRGFPFWAWNGKLEKGQLLRQIDYFADMGMGGFHMHSRSGLDTEYMGKEWLEMISACVDYAESKGLLACLYDDDRWPSGSSGGKVIQDNPEFKAKHIVFTPRFRGMAESQDNDKSASGDLNSESGNLLAAYVIELDENGCLKSSRLLKDVNERDSTSQLWLAYVETDGNSPWYNDQTYVDTLSEKAMAHFIEITHEVYKEKVGSKFGTAIPCIFTDEPQFTRKNQLSNPRGDNDVVFPWTSDLAETFEKAYGSDLLEHLPEIVWNLPDGKPSLARFQYHDHTCERFVSAFMDQLGGWCRKNNLMLNGHMMEEPTLGQQTCAIGEAMRCYRNMDMPGMDLLVDWVEYNTAKQVSSVARQNGLRGAMSELYGVTHWHFTFEGHKGCGDWQAALGITMRVHHLTWFTMRGEGKRDYPASIGYQSPWYKEYGYIENHFARVGVAMTRGKALTRVAVIHPIESYWLSFGPNESGDELGFRERAFSDLTNWLLSGLIDFDFISESLLPGQVSTKRAGYLTVGHCDYDAVIVPNLRTIRSTTLKALRSFSKSGGRVIIAGSGPDLVDAQVPSSSPTIENSKNIFWSSQSILHALEEHRDLRILGMDKAPLDNFLYQMRQDGDERFVFICNRNRDAIYSSTVTLKGIWEVEKLDTFTGEESVLDTCMKDSWTMFDYEFEGTASLLIRLTPTTAPKCDLIRPVGTSTQVGPISISKVELEGVKLSEPNVLMLDYAEYKFNDEDWSPRTEVLKIDNILRRRLDLPLKGSQFKQPWAVPKSDRTPKGRVTLRFTVNTEFTFTESALLALEDVDKIQIHVNDIAISPRCQQTGEASWWVDEDIKTVEIPHYLIHQGKNTVTLSFDFGILTNIERIYLLGDFSVLLEGNAATLQPLDLENISWGDITKQGLPFYVGNVIYKCSYEVPSPPKSSKSDVTLHVPQYSSPVLGVSDVKTEARLGRIAFQPRKLELGESKEGNHEIEVTAYGNRFNSFGHIHAISWVSDGYCGPDIWRFDGDWWTDDYNVKPIGVLECPFVAVTTTKKPKDDETDFGWELVERRRLSGA